MFLSLSVAIALIVAATIPTIAAAEPALEVDLSHSPGSIPRNDEQLLYVAKVRNAATSAPSVGDTLTCNGVPTEWGGSKEWNGRPVAKMSFTYQWLRGGAPISGQSGSIAKGGPRPTYVTVADDAGEVIQCLLKGTIEATNPAESLSSVAVTQPGVVINPAPEPAAPVATVKNSFPTTETIGGGNAVVGSQVRCKAPTDWSGTPAWTFRWLRNGTEIATGETYNVVAADEHTVLQCLAIGKTGTGVAPAGGSAIAVSLNVSSEVGGNPAIAIGGPPAGIEAVPVVKGQPFNAPQIEFDTAVSGTVQLEVELPGGGPETRVYNVDVPGESNKWDCSASEPTDVIPAVVSCSKTDPLAAQEEYPPVKILASLGSGTPDPAVAVAKLSGGGSAPHQDQDMMFFDAATPFGITAFSTKVADPLGADYTQAGGHPHSASGAFELSRRKNGEGSASQVEFLKNIVTDLPPGFLGNPRAVPELCSGTDVVAEDLYANPTCPRTSIVGFADLVLGIVKEGALSTGWPVYAIAPERGAPAQFVIYLNGVKTLISVTPRLRPSEGYAIRIESPALSKNPTVFSVALTLCGYGVNVQEGGGDHKLAPQVTGCKPPTQGGSDPANPIPLLTNQTECTLAPPVTTIATDSWESAGRVGPDGSPDYSDPNWHVAEALAPEITGCEDVPFEPETDLTPSSKRADSPTGFDVTIEMPTEGLETPGEIAQSTLKKAVVTLPEGMAVNPSAADGLGACGSAQIKLGTNEPIACPDSSKVGTAKVTTPLLEETLEGGVYLAKQGDNPFKSLLALYLVVESKERGLLIKIPGKVEADPVTGQLVSTFDDNPQAPFSSLELSFNSGNRAPLLNPAKCGSYDIVSQLYPYSAPNDPVTQTSTFRVTQGPSGGSCPNGSLNPKLNAGIQNPLAGATSPFLVGLSREDGSQRIKGLEMSLPPGLTAYLKGVSTCSDSALASVSGAIGTGQSEIDIPSCPASSQVGSVSVGAGGGTNPFYVHTGRAYLAGPYKGAPLSIAVIAPAVAGPFDLGSVVVRNAAYVDPVSTQIRVVSDPIPTILHGIPIDLRDVRVSVNRPNFTLAPTRCEPMVVGAKVSGEAGASRDLSNRFQVGACDRLGFKPKLSLRLKGGTKRGENPKLIAIVRAREGDANIAALSVRLPRSAFLDQAHIRTICTRVQWAADACPPGSVYGQIQVTTPLLDYPLQGNVYLRSSDNKLPDLVSDLRGPANQPIRVEFSGRTDSVKGALRNTFDFVPDAPFTTARLELFGGKRGLVVNSRDICAKTFRATVQMDAQNGRTHDTQPAVQNDCKKSKRKRAQRSR